MTSLRDLHPPFGLELRAGDLSLSVPDDTTLLELAELAERGIHAPDAMPFYVPWTALPPGELGGSFLRYHWMQRGQWSPESWGLDLAVRVEGELVGMQGVRTDNFPLLRTGETGSWLGCAHQGQGIGTAMRQALCAFLFDHLGAVEVRSGAFVDNPASLAVSRKVGFVADGVTRLERREGEVVENQRLVLTPETFVRGPELAVDGVEEFRRFIGL